MTRARLLGRAATWVVPAAAGQALNLAALAISIAFQLFAEIEQFVFVTAVASIATVVTTLNLQAVYPGLGVDRERQRLMSAGLALTLAAAAVLACVGAVLTGHARPTLLWVAVSLVAMATNAASSAHLVYIGDYVGVAYSRLTAGTCNVVLTTAVVATQVRDDFILVAIADVTLVAATAVMLVRMRGQLHGAGGLLRSCGDLRQVARTARQHSAATGAGFLAGIAFHASSLVTPLLGAYSQAWAVAIRFSGGVSSIGVQILSPRIEATFGRAVRDADVARISRLRRTIVWVAVAMGIACSLSIVAWVVHTDALAGGVREWSVFTVGVVGYCISAVYFSVGSRLLVMGGGNAAGLVLFGVKTVATAIAILVADGLSLILVLGMLELVAVAAYSRQLGASARKGDPE